MILVSVLSFPVDKFLLAFYQEFDLEETRSEVDISDLSLSIENLSDEAQEWVESRDVIKVYNFIMPPNQLLSFEDSNSAYYRHRAICIARDTFWISVFCFSCLRQRYCENEATCLLIGWEVKHSIFIGVSQYSQGSYRVQAHIIIYQFCRPSAGIQGLLSDSQYLSNPFF